MLCQADKARILRPSGKDASYYVQARTREPSTPEYDEHIRTLSFAPGRGSVVGRVLLEGKSVHIQDVLADPGYTLGETARRGGYRTSLGVPLLREGNPIGLLLLHRATVRPFTDKEIELAETFADQAVIAIENVRLFDEVQARTRELSELLERQTATSEVLKVISSSPGELEPVFQAILANATDICEAKFGVLFRYEIDSFDAAAMLNAPQALVEFHRQRGSFQPPAGTPLDRLLKAGGAIYTADEAAESNPGAPSRFGGARSLVTVPMRKENKLVGAIIIYRQEVRPFTDKQIELLTNFAAQAVIAIENARLLNELRESLQQQTATADVLKVISSSPGELEPVFETMLANATQICGAEFGLLYRSEGDLFRTVSLYGAPPAFAEQRRLNPMLRPSSGTALGRVAATKEMVQIPDVQAEPAYQNDPLRRASFLDLAGARTVVCVPMLKDNEVVGAISIYRQQVRPFTDKQIALLTNFAAQAVIAIENVRLSTSCDNRCSSRRRQPTSLRSLVGRRSISGPCSILWWSPLPGFATRTWHRSRDRRAQSSTMSQLSVIPEISRSFFSGTRFRLGEVPSPGALYSKAKPFTSPMFWTIRNIASLKVRKRADIEPLLASHSCAKAPPSAS